MCRVVKRPATKAAVMELQLARAQWRFRNRTRKDTCGCGKEMLCDELFVCGVDKIMVVTWIM